MFSPLYLDNFISATRITPQVRKRARRARRPRRSKLRIFRFRTSTKAQSLRCFSSPHKAVRLCGVPKTGEREKRTVGSLGRLHHAAQFVWTHNVRPAHMTGCYALGLQAVKTPSASCESCQALSALFPIAGARAANTAETISKEWSVYVRKQKILLHEAQGKFLLQ